jgi:cytoskeletal protein CcmA (bactofilin family)
MALFTKKEREGTEPGDYTTPQGQDSPREPKKTMPKNKADAKAKDPSKSTTYLGKNLKIKGNISGEGSLIILGKFEGEFDLKGQLKVAQGAEISGDIKATGVSINGNVDGTIVASERILLDTTAAMKGRLVTPKISIQDGAVFDGELQMSRKSESTPKATTPKTKQPLPAQAASEAK